MSFFFHLLWIILLLLLHKHVLSFSHSHSVFLRKRYVLVMYHGQEGLAIFVCHAPFIFSDTLSLASKSTSLIMCSKQLITSQSLFCQSKLQYRYLWKRTFWRWYGRKVMLPKLLQLFIIAVTRLQCMMINDSTLWLRIQIDEF